MSAGEHCTPGRGQQLQCMGTAAAAHGHARAPAGNKKAWREQGRGVSAGSRTFHGCVDCTLLAPGGCGTWAKAREEVRLREHWDPGGASSSCSTWARPGACGGTRAEAPGRRPRQVRAQNKQGVAGAQQSIEPRKMRRGAGKVKFWSEHSTGRHTGLPFLGPRSIAGLLGCNVAGFAPHTLSPSRVPHGPGRALRAALPGVPGRGPLSGR